MKLLCYSAKLIAGLNLTNNPDLAKRFGIVSSRISSARATLRLIDDIPMLQHTIEYGFGQKVQDRLRIENNLADPLNMIHSHI